MLLTSDHGEERVPQADDGQTGGIVRSITSSAFVA